MKFERIPKQSLVIWEICAVIIFAIILGILIFILNPHTIFWYVILWCVGAIFILCTCLYLPLLYLSSTFLLLEEQFIITKGVIMHRKHHMIIKQISFVSVYTTPITKLTNISSLVVTAPGGNIVLLFMNHNRAVEIAGILSEKSLH